MSTSESRKPVDPSAPSQRFLFETSFDSEALAAEEEAPEPTFSAEEIEAARQAGYAEGDAAGRQDAVNGIEKQLLNGLGRLVEQINAVAEDQARFQDLLTSRSVELALKAIRKMFPALAERDGLVEIEAVLADCLREARSEPKIVIRIAEDRKAPLQERVDALSAAAGHDGVVLVMGDDTLGPADCRVEWAEGGAERVVQHMWQEFEAATQRIFQSAEDLEAAASVPDAPAEEPAMPTAGDDGSDTLDLPTDAADVPTIDPEPVGQANGAMDATPVAGPPPSADDLNPAAGTIDVPETVPEMTEHDPSDDTPNAS